MTAFDILTARATIRRALADACPHTLPLVWLATQYAEALAETDAVLGAAEHTIRFLRRGRGAEPLPAALAWYETGPRTEREADLTEIAEHLADDVDRLHDALLAIARQLPGHTGTHPAGCRLCRIAVHIPVRILAEAGTNQGANE